MDKEQHYSQDYEQHESKLLESIEYPVGVFYVDLNEMYMQHNGWHWHEEMEFDIINSGCARVTVGEDTVLLKAGQGIMINHDALHKIACADSGNCTYFSIAFHPSFLFGYSAMLLSVKYLTPVLGSTTKFLVLSEENRYENDILEHLGNIAAINLSQKFGFELATKSELCQIWMKLFKILKAPTVSTKETKSISLDEIRVKQALSYIQQHHTQPLSLDEISASIHISKSECCRCFKRVLGITPFEYLMKYRIYESARKIYIQDPVSDSISGLAVSVGFNNTSYYNKLFKKYLLCTPNAYKRKIKNNPDTVLDLFGQPLPAMNQEY